MMVRYSSDACAVAKQFVIHCATKCYRSSRRVLKMSTWKGIPLDLNSHSIIFHFEVLLVFGGKGVTAGA